MGTSYTTKKERVGCDGRVQLITHPVGSVHWWGFFRRFTAAQGEDVVGPCTRELHNTQCLSEVAIRESPMPRLGMADSSRVQRSHGLRPDCAGELAGGVKCFYAEEAATPLFPVKPKRMRTSMGAIKTDGS
jgi:hypothetical protein